MTLNEWIDLPEPEEQHVDGRGRHPSGGFAGKLYAAENHAPPDATFGEIRNVAKEAFERGVKVERVWGEQQSSINDF
jgi:hypothetical protein